MESRTVPTGRRRSRRSPDEWRELLDRFDQSAQTREQFCAEHDIGPSTLSRWRQVLRQQAPIAVPHATDALFVELAPDAHAPSTRPWDVELQLGAGVCLRLRRGAC